MHLEEEKVKREKEKKSKQEDKAAEAARKKQAKEEEEAERKAEEDRMKVDAPDGEINANLQSLIDADDLDLEIMDMSGDALNDMEEQPHPKGRGGKRG